jgi:transposase
VLPKLRGRFPCLQRIWADAGYSGSLTNWAAGAAAFGGGTLKIVRKHTGQRSILVLPKPWVVERTFAWLNHMERLIIRQEARADIHEAFLLRGCCLICFKYLERGFC